MANDKKFVAKNGLQTQNASLVSPDVASTITLSMLDSDTLSFSGDAGQLFSITDDLTGTIFAVNDISGIPSIEVDDTGVVRLAEFTGNVLLGTAVDDGINRLQVTGAVAITGDLTASAVTGDVITNDLTLAGIADTSITSTATAVFVYDTSQDSDGGAWRERTSHTSWYNETLNTAERGSTRKFPAVALIVATTTTVTIYDADDDLLPMWMIFTPWAATNAGEEYWRSSRFPTSVTARDGFVCWGVDSSSVTGLVFVNFVSDTFGHRGQIGLPSGYTSEITTRGTETLPDNLAYIVDDEVNDVAITVLADAPIDPSTGLPTPTIAVATDGGVSVITDGGDVWDIYATNANYISVSHVDFVNEEIHFLNESATAPGAYYCVFDIPIADISSAYIWNVDKFTYGPNTTPALYTAVNAVGIVGTDVIAGRAYGNNDYGLTLLKEDLATRANGMVAYITSLYNTGWMQGDIKGAWLSDTTAETIGVDETTELVTNGTFDTVVTPWTGTVATLSVVGAALRITPTGASGQARDTITTVVGTVYTVTAELVGVNGSVAVHDFRLGTTAGAFDLVYHSFGTTPAVFTTEFRATTTTTHLTLYSGEATLYHDWDNISVIETGNLISNGAFLDDTIDWTAGASTLSVVANKLRVTNVATFGYAAQSFTTVIGETYTVTLDFTLIDSIAILRIGTTANNETNGSLSLGGTSTFQFTFIATVTTTWATLINNNATDLFYNDYDNVTCRLADSDRSVNDNGLEVHGQIVKSAVATGAELVGYSGWNTTDYLEQPYNADLDFGTGDFHVMVWLKMTTQAVSNYILDMRDTTSTGFALYVSSTVGLGTQFDTIYEDTGGAIGDGTWTFATVTRISGVQYLYLNGIQKATSAAAQNVSKNVPAFVGLAHTIANPFRGSLALLRTGVGVPTVSQIQEIYDTEKFMFQDNANCTLDGASDAITAMGYDNKTELLHVSTSGGRSTFKDLVRVESDTAAASQSLTAISAQDSLLAESK